MLEMRKKILISLFHLSTVIGLQAQSKQQFFPCVDMSTASSYKAFSIYYALPENKRDELNNNVLWLRTEANCAQENEQRKMMPIASSSIPLEVSGAFQDIKVSSQSNLQSQISGNVRLSNQTIYATETQFFTSPFYENTGLQGEALFECVTGIRVDKNDFLRSATNYFEQTIFHIKYLQNTLGYSFNIHNKKYDCVLLNNPQGLDRYFADADSLAWIVSIKGGHSLLYGPSWVSLKDNLDFKNMVLENVDRLKGIKELNGRQNPKLKNELLDVPIFSMSFGGYFADGLCGKAANFLPSEREAFEPEDLNTEVTEAGQAAISRLLDKKVGRRILMDMAGMNVKSRFWYYNFVKDARYRKDSIPILYTNAGVSGLKDTDNEYENNNEVVKNNQNTYLNHRKYNLCRQDILELVNSQGLFGLSLERDKLMGKMFQTRYGAASANSAERRKIAVEAIVANIYTFIKTAQTIDAWDMICISSNFDMYSRHLEIYDSADKMSQLGKDLYQFFSNPYDIEDVAKKSEIISIMYKIPAQELVEKIMYKNALNFIKKHFPKNPNK